MIYLFINPNQAWPIFQQYVLLLKKHRLMGIIIIPDDFSWIKLQYLRFINFNAAKILSEKVFLKSFQSNIDSTLIFFNYPLPQFDLSGCNTTASFQFSLARQSIDEVLLNQMDYTGFTLYELPTQNVLYQQLIPVLPNDNYDKLQQRIIGYIKPIFWQYLESLLQNKIWEAKQLEVNYYQSEKVLITELKKFLKAKLPDYMVPTHFMLVNSFPLTPSGKIDVQALPLPGTVNMPENEFVAPRNSTEQQLAKIWENTLGIQSISIYDNFFDLGGHSLLAIRVLDRIEKNFNKTLSMLTLFQCPTIAQLAEKIAQQTTIKYKALEIIQDKGIHLPFFFIGSTSLARALIPYLGNDQPIYGLNIFGLQSVSDDPTSLNIEAIATQCISEIQAVQPQGPYYLGGFCGDAKVAFEMAQQLTNSGQTVALVASIDGFVDIIWRWQNHRYDLNHHWSNLLEMGPSYLAQKIRQKSHRFFRRSRLFLLRKLGEKVKRKPQQILSPQLHYTLFINSYFKALSCYEPQPYSGKITLLFSSELRIQSSPERYRLETWSKTNETEIYEIQGYHDNLFVEPQVSILGKQLKACLVDSQKSKDSEM